jgi:hypothetical protein
MYLVLTVAALMAAMIIFAAAPAMADDNRHENRIDRIEDRLENHGFDVDLDDEGDLFLVSPFVFGIDAFDDVGDDDVDVDINFDRHGVIDVDVDV